MAELDRTDIHRDVLQGADLAVRNQLEADLHRLEANIIKTTRKFNECRDEALEAFLGTNLFCHLGWHHVADLGQQYCFIPFKQEPLPCMLTKPELRDRDLPIYEKELVPNSYPVLASGVAVVGARLPDYRDICPHNGLEEYQRLHLECNANAISEGSSSASSDCCGHGVTKLDLLLRLRRKLRAEFAELKAIDEPGKNLSSREHGSNDIFEYSLVQQAQHGTIHFGGLQARRSRRQQLRKQLHSATVLIKEELILAKCQKRVVELRVEVMNGDAAKTRSLVEAREALQRTVSTFFQNRLDHSLSELLVPLNASDPSKCHSISLMPDSHKNMFAPRIFGFPSWARDQLEEYSTSSTGQCYWPKGVDPEEDEYDEDPDDNDDIDDKGHIKSSSTTTESANDRSGKANTTVSSEILSRGTTTGVSGDQNKDYLQVTTLKRYPVDDDKDAPKIRVVRRPRIGVTFELVMPSHEPQRTSHSTPAQHDAQLQTLPEERLSLSSLIRCIRARVGTAERTIAFGLLPNVLTSAVPPQRARITLDMSAVSEDSGLLSIVAGAQASVRSSADVTGLFADYEAVYLALRLDGQVVRFPSDGRLSRLRDLVTDTRDGVALSPLPSYIGGPTLVQLVQQRLERGRQNNSQNAAHTTSQGPNNVDDDEEEEEARQLLQYDGPTDDNAMDLD